MAKKRSRSTLTIECKACCGTGETELNGVFADTFLEVVKWGKPVTAAELARKLNAQPTAMSNRLAWLEREGLLTSVRYGRQRLFTH